MSNFTKKIILFTILFFILFQVYSEPIDSLLKIIKKSTDDSLKAATYLELVKYYKPGEKEYTKYNDSTFEYAKKSECEDLIAISLMNKGLDYTFYAKYDRARKFFDQAILYFEKSGDTLLAARAWGNKGNTYCYQALYGKCLDCFLKTLNYVMSLNNNYYIALTTNNIGGIYLLMEQTNKALEYFQKAYHLYLKDSVQDGIALSTSNIANIFLDRNEIDSAKKYLFISEKSAEKIGLKKQLALTYGNLARVFSLEKNYTKAKEYSLKSINLSKEIKYTKGLSISYLVYGMIAFQNNHFDISELYLDSALTIALDIGLLEYAKDTYHFLAKVDSAKGDFYSAYINYVKYSDLLDSISNSEVEKQLANLQSILDLKLQEKQNALLQEKNEKQQAIIQRQRIMALLIAISFILVLALALLLYIINRQRRKYNLEIEQKNHKLTQYIEKLQATLNLVNKQKSEIEKQNLLMETFNIQIKESLNYAKKIQSAVLQAEYYINKIFPDYFILFKPRDIVSGDFYWFRKIEEIIIVVVADCIGHGVPGAFMSLLGVALLNEIIRRKDIAQPAQVLDLLRDEFKNTLEQTGEGNQLYGMDVAICFINNETNKLQFAGAQNSMYIINKEKINNDRLEDIDNDRIKIFKSSFEESADYSLIEIKGDRQPIGEFFKEIPFTNKEMDLKENDKLYLFSDGFYDQLGGEKMQKYMSNNFKQLLLNNSYKSMTEQKAILSNTLESWKGKDAIQIDDILVVGLKLDV